MLSPKLCAQERRRLPLCCSPSPPEPKAKQPSWAAAEAASSGCVRRKGPDLNQSSVISKQFVSAFGPAAPSPLNYSPGEGREFEVKHECFPQSSIAPGFSHSLFPGFPLPFAKEDCFHLKTLQERDFSSNSSARSSPQVVN